MGLRASQFAKYKGAICFHADFGSRFPKTYIPLQQGSRAHIPKLRNTKQYEVKTEWRKLVIKGRRREGKEEGLGRIRRREGEEMWSNESLYFNYNYPAKKN